MSDSITSCNVIVTGKAGTQNRILVVTFTTNNPTTATSTTAMQDLQTAIQAWANTYKILVNFDGPRNF